MSFNYDDYKDYDDGSKPPKTNWLNALMPVLGLILIVAAGAIAFVLSEPFYQLIITNFDVPAEQELQIVAGGIIFLVVILLYAMIYAAIAPKPKQSVSEAELDREKQQRIKEAQRAKRRKREMRNKMRQRNK